MSNLSLLFLTTLRQSTLRGSRHRYTRGSLLRNRRSGVSFRLMKSRATLDIPDNLHRVEVAPAQARGSFLLVRQSLHADTLGRHASRLVTVFLAGSGHCPPTAPFLQCNPRLLELRSIRQAPSSLRWRPAWLREQFSECLCNERHNLNSSFGHHSSSPS